MKYTVETIYANGSFKNVNEVHNNTGTMTLSGFNQDSRDKQGITRNTVVGDVEIAEAEGSPINRDLGKANEVTKDTTHRSTNINVESQTIEAITNPMEYRKKNRDFNFWNKRKF